MGREFTINPVIARRTALAAGLGGAGALALAACGSSGPSQSAPPAGGGSSDSSGAITALDSIKVGGSIDGTLDGKPILVSRPSTDSAACFSAICTHMGCTVQAAGAQFHCPCHGSVYDAKTGAVIQGPAPRPLPKIPVRVHKGEIVPA
jgi:nitrite reductase/ring-hydroxylating ferredoxin subunit